MRITYYFGGSIPTVAVDREFIPHKGDQIEFPVNKLGEPDAEDFMQGTVSKVLYPFNDEGTIAIDVVLAVGRYFK